MGEIVQRYCIIVAQCTPSLCVIFLSKCFMFGWDHFYGPDFWDVYVLKWPELCVQAIMQLFFMAKCNHLLEKTFGCNDIQTRDIWWDSSSGRIYSYWVHSSIVWQPSSKNGKIIDDSRPFKKKRIHETLHRQIIRVYFWTHISVSYYALH